MAVPGNGEHHSAVTSVRDHDGRIRWEERPVQDDVHALARRDHRLGFGIVQALQFITKGTGGVDDATCLQSMFFTCFVVAEHEAINQPLCIL